MSDAADELGRGKRELKSRMVLVDGQPVLRLNNYDLLSGEPSVFDRELGDGVTAEARTRYVPREPVPKRVVERRAPAPPSAIEQQRMGRNDEIKREKERGNARCRAVFLQEHATLFREFGARIPPADAASAALARLPGEREALVRELAAAKILEQPDSIKVPMRQYQLDGLRWLASAHAKGHSAILADEMGLGTRRRRRRAPRPLSLRARASRAPRHGPSRAPRARAAQARRCRRSRFWHTSSSTWASAARTWCSARSRCSRRG